MAVKRHGRGRLGPGHELVPVKNISLRFCVDRARQSHVARHPALGGPTTLLRVAGVGGKMLLGLGLRSTIRSALHD
jgi:hypothetical protein